jgi:cyclopropane fatty-acyl-phospholipid synthase-like methyltransferase
MNWFEEWFDSPLYEKLYVDRDEKEAARLIQLLEETLPLDEKSKVLDLGCGRGRHSINLYEKGYKVTGIDLSEQAIETAREKAANQGLDGLSFKVCDMRNPLPETFDAIVNLFTTFGYFLSDEENASVFDSVRKMLKPGGIFVLDFLNAEKVRNSFQPDDEGEFHGIHYEIERYIDDNAVHKEITFSGEKVDGQQKYSERVKLYGLPWFEREMKKRDLKIDHVFGDYDGNEFDPKTSPRLLIISHLRG